MDRLDWLLHECSHEVKDIWKPSTDIRRELVPIEHDISDTINVIQ